MAERDARRVTRREALVKGGAFLGALGGAPLLSACSGFGSGSGRAEGGGGNAHKITIWDIQTDKQRKLLERNAAKFNSAHADIKASYNWFQNDPYKQKLQVSMGAGNPPDIWMGWGGGVLASYVDAGDVYDLSTALTKASTKRFFPSVLDAATIDGKLYGVPYTGVQPVVFEYNKALFDKHGLTAPRTWNDLRRVVTKLKGAGVIPIALGGQSTWTYLMYEEYLVDRIGGPSVFDAVIAGKPKAWSHPAVLEANTKIRQLIDAGAFGNDFAGVSYDTGQSTALLTTEKAAMQLMGVWDFNSILSSKPDFISKLGLMNFPTVEHGKGDPKNVTGNLANYYSVSQHSKAKKAATTYLEAAALNDFMVGGYLKLDAVPPVRDIEDKLDKAAHPDFVSRIYHMTKNAPHYQLSWDQALSPKAAQQLLTNLERLFLAKITPEQFSATMDKTL